MGKNRKSAFLSKQGNLELFLSDCEDIETEHWHSDFEILMPISGVYSAVFNNKRYSLKKEDICLIPPGSVHSINAESKDSFCLHIRLSDEHYHNQTPFIVSMPYHFPCAVFWKEDSFNRPEDSIQEKLVATLKTILKEANDGISFEQTKMKYLFEVFITNVTKYEFALMNLPSPRYRSPDNYQNQLVSICSYIRTHGNEALTVHSLASLTEYSDSYFSVLFKNYVGISCTEYIQITQLLLSISYLTEDSLSINEISKLSGFHSIRTYHRCFHSFFHCTPQQYRKKYLQF